MSRVIQDSDEELEEDLEVAVCQQDLIEAPPKQSTSNASSTGKGETRSGVSSLIILIQKLCEDK